MVGNVTDKAPLASQLLQRQLDLAILLLKNARECRDGVDREEEVIAAAREAYRYTMESQARMPALSAVDAKKLATTFQEFRLALSRVVKIRHAHGA